MRKDENTELIKCGGENNSVLLDFLVGKCTSWSWWRNFSYFKI